MKLFILLALVTFLGASGNALGFSDCSSQWKSKAASTNCEMVDVEVTVTYPASKKIHPFTKSGNFNIRSKVRAGYMPESADVPFRGNILYLQGLGDSMQNHVPLFSRLTGAGFRVMAYDYMGQGGSEGSMNDTRISDIYKIGMDIFYRYGRDITSNPKPIMLGWSTGGLAAYAAALKGYPKSVVLIAPGIVPNFIKVGSQDVLHLKFYQITLETLTTDRYPPGAENPHVDPIQPSSPLNVPDFAFDLWRTSSLVQGQSTSRVNEVTGFVLLSGEKDTYVKAEKTKAVLKKNAPHFQVLDYPGALHEIDNERVEIRGLVHQHIVNFLSVEPTPYPFLSEER